MWLSLSTTTRSPRPGEVNGRDYQFVDRAEFERIRDAGGFLESFEVYGELKGTPRAPIEEHLAAGVDVLLELDVQGALAVRSEFPEALLIFVSAPSRSSLRARLVSRGQDDPDQITRRLAEADGEEAHVGEFDAVVVNDDLVRAVAEVADILVVRRNHDVARSPDSD